VGALFMAGWPFSGAPIADPLPISLGRPAPTATWRPRTDIVWRSTYVQLVVLAWLAVFRGTLSAPLYPLGGSSSRGLRPVFHRTLSCSKAAAPACRSAARRPLKVGQHFGPNGSGKEHVAWLRGRNRQK